MEIGDSRATGQVLCRFRSYKADPESESLLEMKTDFRHLGEYAEQGV